MNQPDFFKEADEIIAEVRPQLEVVFRSLAPAGAQLHLSPFMSRRPGSVDEILVGWSFTDGSDRYVNSAHVRVAEPAVREILVQVTKSLARGCSATLNHLEANR